ncbi:ATP-binding protein [Ferdinandcohnia quinoae]|uniref:Circadian input-output histidine kinase CikA n=1 Tax=Fredinandcohnia quinoae TaxID=2918902 RepID=A0AAW5DU32_9BACI|nr:ATP-binding protein [Fredinandcohnia sp. SECRCQ15]MCH1624136.1 ATP-binding protein [Fredinandcohnia sp. SECRCQ15]
MKLLKRKKWILLIITFLIAITSIRLVWMNFLTKFDYDNNPPVVNGVLDLQGMKLSNNQTLTLNGEWEFYPSVFLKPNQLASDSSKPKNKKLLLQTPNAWKHAFDKKSDSSNYFGTYRLRILLDDNTTQTLGLRIEKVKEASSVYVNGEHIGGIKQSEIESNPHLTNYNPYSMKFKPNHNEIEILIHASSDRKDGGIIKPIRFGSIEAINHRDILSIGLQLFLCVVFFLHSLYAIILYFIGPKPKKGLLYFSLLLICATFSVLVADDKLLYRLFTINFEWKIKIGYLTYIGVSAFIPSVINSLYPNHPYKKIVRFFSLYCILYSLFVLIAPSEYNMQAAKVLLSTALVSSIFISTIILRKAISKISDIIFPLLGCISIGVNLIWVMVISRLSFVGMPHYPFDLMIAILAFTIFWFKRFFRVSAEANELAERLQIEDKRKDEFLINTSHELRNPLHGIINIIQAILDDQGDPPNKNHSERLHILLNVSNRMSLMLNDLLDVTRLKEKMIRLHPKKVQLQAVVTGVLDMARLMVEGKPIYLHHTIDDTFPPVKADEKRLIQILFNLIHNAVKFTDEGTITIRASIINSMVKIEVEDTGIGISEKELNRVFLPYQQADTNEIRESGGFGLGLSLCKQLVELHGGILSAQSTKGKGSIFSFTIPLFDNSIEDVVKDPVTLHNEGIEQTAASINYVHQISNTNRSIAGKGIKILAVDDDVINLNVLIQILESEKYEITAVTSGTQAVAKLEHEQYDLVISDVMMPTISGYELTRIIRERYSIAELPVLLLTARTRAEDILSGFQVGANDYVRKPVDSMELKARVQALTQIKISIEERLQMESAWLQSQIQPHFLFNTLNSIAALGMTDTVKMQLLLEEFSDYLRLSFDFKNSEPVVSLEHELSLVRSYLYIEGERFGDRLKIEWEIDDNIDLTIPPLSIQPLVENAVKHGILKRASGGNICIQIKELAEYVEVSIIDDGIGMTENNLEQLFIRRNQSNTNSGVALQNINRRLKQLYGKGLNIHSTPGNGTIVSFRIPNKE